MSDMSLLSWADTYVVLTTAITIIITATVFPATVASTAGCGLGFCFLCSLDVDIQGGNDSILHATPVCTAQDLRLYKIHSLGEDEIICNDKKLVSGSTAAFVRSCEKFMSYTVFGRRPTLAVDNLSSCVSSYRSAQRSSRSESPA